MKRYSLCVLGLGLAAASIAAGCGSSSNDNSTTTSSLTKAEWTAKANAICAAGNQQTNQAANQQFGNQKPTADQIKTFVTGTIIPSVQSQVDQIKALGAPSEIQQQANSLFSLVQADLDKAKADPTLLVSGNAFQDANAAARGLGLSECGKG
jgi:hypothetical protein